MKVISHCPYRPAWPVKTRQSALLADRKTHGIPPPWKEGSECITSKINIIKTTLRKKKRKKLRELF